jgi:hypothetical protein
MICGTHDHPGLTPLRERTNQHNGFGISRQPQDAGIGQGLSAELVKLMENRIRFAQFFWGRRFWTLRNW